MSGKFHKINLARRYADALLDLSTEQNKLGKVEEDMIALRRLFESSADLARVTKSKILDRKEIESALSMLFTKAEFSSLITKFVKVVSENRRIEILPEIIEVFFERVAERAGEVTAEVTTATALNDSEKQKLKSVLAKISGKKIHLAEKIAPKILGGVKIKIGSQLLDASLAGKLERMRINLEKS